MEWDLEEEDKLNIAILSGKGGTGKTTVSTNLSAVIGANYIDCDVEEPNGFIFLNPSQIKKKRLLLIVQLSIVKSAHYVVNVQKYASLMP